MTSRRTFLGSADAALAAQQRRSLKVFIFILCDMDSSSGIAREHVAMEARETFTADINATSAAAPGVTGLIVCDTHHGGGDSIQDNGWRLGGLHHQRGG